MGFGVIKRVLQFILLLPHPISQTGARMQHSRGGRRSCAYGLSKIKKPRET